ncbi:hypothetical protein KR038_005176, partial [Drosophila bunnanda]
VNEADRPFQLIVWRRDPSESLRLYKLNTVTYGTGPAPFLAIRCLKRLSESAKLSFPRAADVIGSDFYIDDMLTGAACIEELRTIKSEVSQVLQTAGSSSQHQHCEPRTRRVSAACGDGGLSRQPSKCFGGDGPGGMCWASKSEQSGTTSRTTSRRDSSSS